MNALEARRRILGRNVYKRTTEGNPAIAQGSLARRYPGITMQGWTEQAQYEGKNLFDATKDINVSYDGMVNTEYNTYIGNGSIEISAENLRQQSKGKQLGEFNGKTLCLSLTAREGKVAIAIFSNGTLKENLVFEIGVRRTVYFIVDSENYVLTFAKAIYGSSKNVVAENIMMNEGSTAMPYEPYTGGQPSPNPDYPQPITSAGKYDEETQKWEYEIAIANAQTDPDKNQTVALTADRPLTKWDKLEKRNGQWGWVYKSNEVVFDGSEAETWGTYNNRFYILGGLKDITLDTTLHAGSLSDKFHYGKSGDHAYFLVTNTGSSYSPIFYYSGIADVESWKQFLAENNVSYLYPTEAETFVPLAASEQEQMNALYTYRPTTVLSNNAGCNMELTYKTKKSLEVAT